MKKVLFVMLVLFISSISVKGQIVSSSSLVVTKTTKMQPQYGYEQSIDLSYSSIFTYLGVWGLDVNYIGGWRFNRMFYAGLGTGLYISPDYGTKELWGDFLSMPVVSLPLYAHGKVYFTKKQFMPFLGLSIGGLFSLPKTIYSQIYGEFTYSTCRFILNPMVGGSYRINGNVSVYLSAGFKGITMPHTRGSYYSGRIELKNDLGLGFDVHLGCTF